MFIDRSPGEKVCHLSEGEVQKVSLQAGFRLVEFGNFLHPYQYQDKLIENGEKLFCDCFEQFQIPVCHVPAKKFAEFLTRQFSLAGESATNSIYKSQIFIQHGAAQNLSATTTS